MDASPSLSPYSEDWVQLATHTTKLRFWIAWGRAIAILIFFVGIVITLENDRPGLPRIIGTVVIVLTFGAVFAIFFRLFYLLAIVLSWKCPRCGTKWPGFVTKENHCMSCGLALVSPLNS
jgi:hypothetical protein